MNAPPSPQAPNPTTGVVCALGAFLIWGLGPLYWKALQAVGAFEITLHRVLWSFCVLMPLTLVCRRREEFSRTVRTPRLMLILSGTALLVGANWLLYVWAINNARVIEASLGYYINPLVNILLGFLFLRERLRPAQTVAVVLATIAVLNLTIHHGIVPWVPLGLAFSFGIYGLIRKVAAVGALVGLTIETLLLTVPAGIWLLHLHRAGGGAFLHAGIHIDLLLMGTGLLTATPLLLFNLGARRITLATLGFIQYTAPTGMLILGVTRFGEPFTRIQAITFGLIWVALTLYSWDTLRARRQRLAAGRKMFDAAATSQPPKGYPGRNSK